MKKMRHGEVKQLPQHHTALESNRAGIQTHVLFPVPKFLTAFAVFQYELYLQP